MPRCLRNRGRSRLTRQSKVVEKALTAGRRCERDVVDRVMRLVPCCALSLCPVTEPSGRQLGHHQPAASRRRRGRGVAAPQPVGLASTPCGKPGDQSPFGACSGLLAGAAQQRQPFAHAGQPHTGRRADARPRCWCRWQPRRRRRRECRCGTGCRAAWRTMLFTASTVTALSACARAALSRPTPTSDSAVKPAVTSRSTCCSTVARRVPRLASGTPADGFRPRNRPRI